MSGLDTNSITLVSSHAKPEYVNHTGREDYPGECYKTENGLSRGGKRWQILQFLCSPAYVFGDGLWRRGSIARLHARETKPVQISGALQSVLNTRANIFSANVPFKICLLHELRRLLTCAAEEERAARFVELVGKIFYGAQARGVDGGHIAQT